MTILCKKKDYYAEQKRQRGISMIKEIKKILDTIESDSSTLYLTVEQDHLITKELEEDSRRFIDSLNKDKKQKAHFSDLQKDERIQKAYDQLAHTFEVLDKQEQDFLVKSKRFAASTVKYTDELVKLGYSPLDVLVHYTCRIPEGNRRIYKMVWDALYESGFLEKCLNSSKGKR
jgi:hypothetical protein